MRDASLFEVSVCGAISVDCTISGSKGRSAGSSPLVSAAAGKSTVVRVSDSATVAGERNNVDELSVKKESGKNNAIDAEDMGAALCTVTGDCGDLPLPRTT